jgi:N-acetylmuramoyl-L-alanine amidase CwlA
MNLRKLIFTENLCYKRNVEKYDSRYTTFQSRGPKGIMVHSTGSNNPELRRYVAPDDGLLGENEYNNHWNQPMDRLVCVHAFIGKLKDGSVATYQTLPWNFRGWHAGDSANDTHISFEICEDNLKDASYFKKVYQEAVELCVYLCKEFGLTEKDIICHSEGCAKGIASNHADVMHWFPKHGKSMDTFRADVKALLNKKEEPPEEPVKEPTQKPVTKDIEVGDVVTLTANAVYYSGKTIPDWVKADKWIVKSVSGDRVVIDKSVDGKHSIMSPVNAKYLNVVNTSTSSGSTVEKLYPNEKTDYAESFATSVAGLYKVNARSGLYLRSGASTSKKAIELMNDGSHIRCYGYYTGEWLYVVSDSGKKGFCHSDYLEKV